MMRLSLNNSDDMEEDKENVRILVEALGDAISDKVSRIKLQG